MHSNTSEQAICSIRSTTDDDGKAACLLEWGPVRALLAPAVVLATARDLMAAAVAAETDVALIETLRNDVQVDDRVLGVMLQKVRGHRPAPRGKAALRIAAVAGAKPVRPIVITKPYVTIARGSMAGQLDPDEARAMAQNWTEVAIAAAIDVRLRYALGEWDRLNVVEIEELFTIMQSVQGQTIT